MNPEMTLYRYIPVWRRVDNGTVLYRCFEIIGQGFVVQSKDFFTIENATKQRVAMEAQFIELLIEEAPERRGNLQNTIEAAVLDFDSQFED